MNLERQLANLQAGLRSKILTSDLSTEGDGKLDLSSLESTILLHLSKYVLKNIFLVILTIDNEVEYWNNVLNVSKSSEKRKAATTFCDILSPLAKDFRYENVD